MESFCNVPLLCRRGELLSGLPLADGAFRITGDGDWLTFCVSSDSSPMTTLLEISGGVGELIGGGVWLIGVGVWPVGGGVWLVGDGLLEVIDRGERGTNAILCIRLYGSSYPLSSPLLEVGV